MKGRGVFSRVTFDELQWRNNTILPLQIYEVEGREEDNVQSVAKVSGEGWKEGRDYVVRPLFPSLAATVEYVGSNVNL